MKYSSSSFDKRKNYSSKPSAPRISKNRLIIGRKPMIEALNNRSNIDKIFILKSANGEDIQQIISKAKEQNIVVSFVPQEKIDRFTKVPTQGVVALAGLIQYHDLQNAIDHVVGNGEVPLFVVLDGITDTRNLGAIARSAFCFGAQAIVLPTSNSAAVTEESIKTSAGALEKMIVCRESSIEQIMDILHLNGLATIATDLKGQKFESSELLAQPLAVIMGAEDTGISKYVIKKAQHLVRIPQSNNFDSLNVSVATGVLLYEVFKTRS